MSKQQALLEITKHASKYAILSKSTATFIGYSIKI